MVFGVIVVTIIVALFLAWINYQKARDRERMYLLEKGGNLNEIFQIQNKNKFKFIFPWLKLGIVVSGMSVSFLAIAFLVLVLEKDQELFKGFLITAILGVCLGVALIINHFVGKKENNHHG